MAIFSLGQKNNQTDDQNAEAEKKIEFAQKLPAGEVEGTAAAKGGNFDFLKDSEPREPGEAVPIKMADEPAAQNESPQEEAAPAEEPKRESWFSRLLKLGADSDEEKNPSRVLEVNLVKGEIVKFFDWQRGMLLLLIAVFITMAVLSGVYWGISWWGANSQSAQNNDYLQQYYKISKEINDLNPQVNEVLAFKTKLDQVNFLLDRHIYWTNFFSFLEKNTLSNIYFSDFGGTINGSYSLGATTDNFDAIDAQIKKFLANPLVEKAEVNTGSVGGVKGKPAISFSLSFVLDPKIFLNNN